MSTRRHLLQASAALILGAQAPDGPSAELILGAQAPDGPSAEKASPQPGCVFCEIERGEREATLIYKDAELMAFASKHAFAPGHTLVVPRRHVENVYGLDERLAGQVFAVAARIARTIKRVLKPDGLTLRSNNEPGGDQTVFHFHLHLVPRMAGVPYCDYPRPLAEPDAAERERIFAPLRADLAG